MKKFSFTNRRSSIEPVRLSMETPVQNTGASSRNSRSFIPRPHSKQRSSSDNRPGINKPGPSSLVRSKSNLGVSCTPIASRASQNKKSLTQTNECPSAMRTGPKDNRPFDDKHWQLETTRKIESFLMNENIYEKRLKDLTVNTFVHICNELLKRLDPMFNITVANYIEQLPLILKKLGYQLPLTKSLMVSVNIPRNVGLVLGIIEALVDVSDKSQNYYDEEDLISNQAGKAYAAWLNGMDNAIGIYGEELYNELSTEHREQSEYLQNQHRALQERLIHAENTKMKKLESEKEMLQTKEDLRIKEEEIEKLKDVCEHKMKELKKTKIRLNNLELQKAECKAELRQIEARIKNQGITMEEYKNLIDECQEVNASIKQRLEMIKDVENFQDKMTRDLEEQKKIVSELMKKFSHQLMKSSFEFSEFNDFSIPTFPSLTDPGNEEILNEIIIKYKNMIDSKEASLRDIKESIERKTRCNQEIASKIEAIILKNKKIKIEIESELQKKEQLLQQLNENKKKYTIEKNQQLETLNEPLDKQDSEQIIRQIEKIEKAEKHVEKETEKVIKQHKELMQLCGNLEANFLKEFNVLLDSILKLHKQYNDKMKQISDI